MGLLNTLFNKKTNLEDIPELGRNEPCWCGSGKKYKRCHMPDDQTRKNKLIQETTACNSTG